MFILIAVVISCSVGIAAHFVLPGKDLRGAAVSGAIATVTTAVIYTVLQWAGLAENSIWLWLASLGGGIIASFVGTMFLTRSRARRDAERAVALGLTPEARRAG